MYRALLIIHPNYASLNTIVKSFPWISGTIPACIVSCNTLTFLIWSIVQGVSKKSMQYLKVDLQLAPMNELAFDWLKLFSFVGDQCICSNFIIYSSSHTFAQTSIPPSMGYFFHKFQKLWKFNEASKILYFTAFYFISVRNKFMEFFMKINSARKRSRKMFCIWFCK